MFNSLQVFYIYVFLEMQGELSANPQVDLIFAVIRITCKIIIDLWFTKNLP